MKFARNDTHAVLPSLPNVPRSADLFQSPFYLSLYEICPDTNPDLIGMSQIATIETQLDIPFSQCEPMTKVNCESDLSFSLTGVTAYYPPNGLPASGTATLSNVPGSVTAPPSGSVFSYTNGADAVVYTISAAAAPSDGSSSATVTESSDSNGGGGSSSGSSGSSGSEATGSAGSKDSAASVVSASSEKLIITLVTLALFRAFR